MAESQQPASPTFRKTLRQPQTQSSLRNTPQQRHHHSTNVKYTLNSINNQEESPHLNSNIQKFNSLWLDTYKYYCERTSIQQQQIQQLRNLLDQLTKKTDESWHTPLRTGIHHKSPKLRITRVIGMKLQFHKIKPVDIKIPKKLTFSSTIQIGVGTPYNLETPRREAKKPAKKHMEISKQCSVKVSQQNEQLKMLRPFTWMMKAVVDLMNILWPCLKKTTKPQSLVEIKNQTVDLQNWFNGRVKTYNKTQCFNSTFVLETVEKVGPLVDLVQKAMIS